MLMHIHTTQLRATNSINYNIYREIETAAVHTYFIVLVLDVIGEQLSIRGRDIISLLNSAAAARINCGAQWSLALSLVWLLLIKCVAQQQSTVCARGVHVCDYIYMLSWRSSEFSRRNYISYDYARGLQHINHTRERASRAVMRCCMRVEFCSVLLAAGCLSLFSCGDQTHGLHHETRAFLVDVRHLAARQRQQNKKKLMEGLFVKCVWE